VYLGIDLGTSSIKTVLMDETQHIIAGSSAGQAVSRPQESWSEQAPADWIRGIEDTLTDLQSKHASEMAAVRGIGLSGQMHGATLLDASDQVIRPCILWNDTRSYLEAEALDTARVRELCGNIIFPGFTAPKLKWLAAHEPAHFARVAKVLLPKDYARLWLTGEHVSEMSDAAGTGWLDVGKREWSDELLALTQLEQLQMPRLVEGTDVSGMLRAELAQRYGLPANVTVAGGAGDNAASACGMGTVAAGSAFLSLGTSGVLFAATETYQPNAASAVHTFCHALPGSWHQMGVILAATDAPNWLATAVNKQPAELTAALEGLDVAPTKVIFLPYLGGERTPYNDASARGVFVGLGHATDANELTRAVLQGVSFAFRDCQQALSDAGTKLDSAFAIGGGSHSQHWLQMLANILKLPLDTTVEGDFGAGFGAARLGMIAANSADPLAICQPPDVAHTIEPDMTCRDEFDAQYLRYRQTYQALKPIMS
jgi:xylulokinase